MNLVAKLDTLNYKQSVKNNNKKNEVKDFELDRVEIIKLI